jgi:ArsR family transcriptional regulator
MYFELLADFLKVIAQPTRLKILEVLRGRELCVCEIVPLVDGEQSNISKHISLLEKYGLVSTRREGVRVLVKANPLVYEVLEKASQVLRNLLQEQKKRLDEAERRL